MLKLKGKRTHRKLVQKLLNISEWKKSTVKEILYVMMVCMKCNYNINIKTNL